MVNVVHSPTRKLFKGTDIVEEAISILKSQGVQFNYKLVSGLPWEEYIQVMKEADMAGESDLDLFVPFEHRADFFVLCRQCGLLEVVNPVAR